MVDSPSELATPNQGESFAVTPAPLDAPPGAPEYGSQVPPKAPRQNMYAIDELAGGPVSDRRADPSQFTGGDGEYGLGGQANSGEPGAAEGAAVLGQRIGI